MTKDLTYGAPAPLLFKFSIPVILGNLFQLFYTLADTVIVGRTLGPEALAAVGATGTIIYFILCFVQGLTSGFAILLAQYFGAGDEKNVRRCVGISTLLSLFFSIVITAVICILARPVLAVMDTPGDIFELAYDYMIVIFYGAFTTIFYNLISNILRALGDSRTPLYFLVFSSLLNIVLDIVFIVPLDMGVGGAAWATNLSQLLAAVFCAAYAVQRFDAMRLKRSDWNLDRFLVLQHLKIGFPMGFQMSVMCIGQMAMQAAVNAIGTNAVAGYTAATKVDQMSVLVNNAFGVTLSTYVAQNYGAGKIDRIKRGFNACFLMTECANLLMGALILLIEPVIVPLFVDSPGLEILSFARTYFLVVIPFYPVLGALLCYRTAVQSMGNPKAPFLACVIELVLRVVCALLLSRFWGYPGICFSTPMAWIGATALLIPVYYAMLRRLLNMQPPQCEN